MRMHSQNCDLIIFWIFSEDATAGMAGASLQVVVDGVLGNLKKGALECGPLEVYGSEVALCIVVHRWKAWDKNLLSDLELGFRVYSYFGKIIELQIFRKVY